MEPLVCKGTYAWDMNKRNKQQSLAYGCTHMHHLIFDFFFFCKDILTFMRGKKDESRNRIVSLDFDFLPTILTITTSIKRR